MSDPGSPAASDTASPQLRDITGHEEAAEASPNSPIRTTSISSEQLDGISSSKDSHHSFPLPQIQSTTSGRLTSSSSISSLRRKRREDKKPEEIHRSSSSSESSLPGSYTKSRGGDTSDVDSVDSRSGSINKESHNNSGNPLQGESSHASQIVPVRTSSNIVPSYSHESFDAEMQNLADGNFSEFEGFGPPPPPPKGDDYNQLVRNRGTSQSSNSASRDMSLAQALLIEAPEHRQATPYYTQTNARVRASSSSSGPENALPAVPGSSTPIPLSNIRQNSYVLPRWQSDAEVTFCPICKTQFSEWFNGP